MHYFQRWYAGIKTTAKRLSASATAKKVPWAVARVRGRRKPRKIRTIIYPKRGAPRNLQISAVYRAYYCEFIVRMGGSSSRKRAQISNSFQNGSDWSGSIEVDNCIVGSLQEANLLSVSARDSLRCRSTFAWNVIFKKKHRSVEHFINEVYVFYFTFLILLL